MSASTSSRETVVWVVYNNPSDYPQKFVVRRQYAGAKGVRADALPVAVAESLQEARRVLPPGLVCITRSDDDDKVIEETWI